MGLQACSGSSWGGQLEDAIVATAPFFQSADQMKAGVLQILEKRKHAIAPGSPLLVANPYCA